MGAVRDVKGCCPLDCQDTCAWVARVEDGRVTGVTGAKDHPITRGSLCAKVKDYETRTYAPDRLLHPLIRTGEKGAGEFRRASWDEAVALIADRFSDIIATHGAEALLPHSYLGSLGVVQRRALRRLFHVLGASREIGGVCGMATGPAEDDGHPVELDPEDMTEARYVLMWGANPLTTSHHNWHFVAEARRRHGARIVCIDPVRTRTARAADEHVAIRPGTDWALAVGIGHVLLAEELVDRSYAQRVAADFDAYAEQAAGWTPEVVAATCGIDADVVVRIAREFAAARPALIRAGVGVQQSVGGDGLVRAMSALALLCGHWEHRGGGVFMSASPDMDSSIGGRPDLVPGDPRTVDISRLGWALTDLDPPIHGFMVWGANPAAVQIDASRMHRGLAREDLFTVVVEHFLTDTARYADVVLPSTTQLEHFDLQNAWGHHYISVNERAVEPVGESRTHGEIMRALAARMGLDHPALQESDEQIAASALPDGVTLEALRAAGWIKWSPAPFTPGARPLPLVAEVPAVPQMPTDGTLQLLTPKPHHFLNTTFVNMPRHRAAMSGPTLYLHPADAAERGVVDGDEVDVANASGSVRARAAVTDDVIRGVATLPGKWWIRDVGGAGVNALTPAAWSPGGQPAFNETFVRVEKSIPAPGGTSAQAHAGTGSA